MLNNGGGDLDIYTMVLMGFGMAMDAFAVSVTNGLAARGRLLRCALLCSLYFGLAQMLMPLLGYFVGYGFSGYIQRFDHWVALILLCFLGVRMLREAGQHGRQITAVGRTLILTSRLLLVQAVATSVDALALGVSLSAIGANIFLAAPIIGLTTFCCCVVGAFLGRRFGDLLGKFAEIAGGLILAGIGLKIFLEHTV